MSEIARQELGISLQKLREMVAASDTFQEAIGGGFGDALDRVYLGTQYGEVERPFAIIQADRLTASLIAGGAMNYLRPAGDIGLLLEIDADEDADTDTDRAIAAMEFVDGVRKDLTDLASKDNTTGEFNESDLPVVTATIASFRESDINFRRSEGHYFSARLTITWGDG